MTQPATSPIEPPKHLAAVTDDTFGPDAEFAPMRTEQAPKAPYEFEGETIDGTNMKCTSASDLEIGDRRLKLHDLVELKVVGRVTNVDHKYIEGKNRTVRVHTVKIVEVTYEQSYSPAGGVAFT